MNAPSVDFVIASAQSCGLSLSEKERRYLPSAPVRGVAGIATAAAHRLLLTAAADSDYPEVVRELRSSRSLMGICGSVVAAFLPAADAAARIAAAPKQETLERLAMAAHGPVELPFDLRPWKKIDEIVLAEAGYDFAEDTAARLTGQALRLFALAVVVMAAEHGAGRTVVDLGEQGFVWSPETWPKQDLPLCALADAAKIFG